jgi:hypothetical protein
VLSLSAIPTRRKSLVRYLRMLILIAVFTMATAGFAQGGAAAAPSPAPQAQPSPAPTTNLAAVVERQVSQYEKNVIDVAEAMPEDKYNFSPVSLNIPGAAYKDVRTFAQLLKHTGTANFRFWTTLTGEKMPTNITGPNGPDELKSKAEIIQFLKDSFAVGHRAAKTISPENATEQVSFFGRPAARIFVASGAVIHAADEYGQMVEYLRMNGIVPPASAGR